jgi:hypothetical protein
LKKAPQKLFFILEPDANGFDSSKPPFVIAGIAKQSIFSLPFAERNGLPRPLRGLAMTGLEGQ